ncbi:hypothetical protein IMZ48_09870 [Candidatus Bathyarchaeota archaeon]|nr:hypothetical protein [Candidatus Bathyarchaeota archaeon]
MASVEGSLLDAISGAATAPPADYVHQQGWVLTAFRNALWQLLHSQDLEEGVVDTVMRGGDTIPGQWVESLLNCRPAAGQLHLRHPRPECFWLVDALELTERLVSPAPGQREGRPARAYLC